MSISKQAKKVIIELINSFRTLNNSILDTKEREELEYNTKMLSFELSRYCTFVRQNKILYFVKLYYYKEYHEVIRIIGVEFV